jgi:putative chitinase
MLPDIAYRIMAVGMRRGLFQGSPLSRYINGDKCDYRGARRVVNGLDKADQIEDYARRFMMLLTVARK